jgi:hypothetical protein
MKERVSCCIRFVKRFLLNTKEYFHQQSGLVEGLSASAPQGGVPMKATNTLLVFLSLCGCLITVRLVAQQGATEAQAGFDTPARRVPAMALPNLRATLSAEINRPSRSGRIQAPD